MARDLEMFFKEQKLTDFTIVMADQELTAHRAVLSARSPVFAAMLEPHTEEAQTGRVSYDDIEPDVALTFSEKKSFTFLVACRVV